MGKDAWMAEVSKDAEKRFQDKKVRRERADTLKTQAMKAFRRAEYDRALSCYNRAIDQIRDDAMLYCDRALTKIKLGKFDQVSSRTVSTSTSYHYFGIRSEFINVTSLFPDIRAIIFYYQN